MFTRGKPPFLECSTRGDKRFSALHARPKGFAGRSIAEIYEGAKVFPDGQTGLTWRDTKSKTEINPVECERLYLTLWSSYLDENPDLKKVLIRANGLSGSFSAANSVCEVSTLWRIRDRLYEDLLHDL